MTPFFFFVFLFPASFSLFTHIKYFFIPSRAKRLSQVQFCQYSFDGERCKRRRRCYGGAGDGGNMWMCCQNGRDLYTDFPCYDKILPRIPHAITRRCCRSDAANLNACVANFISFSFRPNQMRINENNMHGQKGSAFVLRYSHFFFCVIAYSANCWWKRKEWKFQKNKNRCCNSIRIAQNISVDVQMKCRTADIY